MQELREKSYLLQNMNILKAEGFSQEQIERGVEVLLYPPHKLIQVLDNRRLELGAGRSREDLQLDPLAVPLLAYAIGKYQFETRVVPDTDLAGYPADNFAGYRIFCLK